MKYYFFYLLLFCLVKIIFSSQWLFYTRDRYIIPVHHVSKETSPGVPIFFNSTFIFLVVFFLDNKNNSSGTPLSDIP